MVRQNFIFKIITPNTAVIPANLMALSVITQLRAAELPAAREDAVYESADHFLKPTLKFSLSPILREVNLVEELTKFR